jgi:hypothetical protein
MASGDTNVTICSDALVMLGESPITSFTGDVGDACSAMYEDVKRSTLQMYPWSFSINRYDPASTRASATNLWTYRFTHPSEDGTLDPIAFEGVRALYNSTAVGAQPINDGWEYRGTYVFTNEPSILIEYQENTAEANLPSYFVQLLKYQLAWHLAETVTDQITKAEYWRQIALGSPVENMRGGYFRSATSIDGGSKQIQSIDDYALIGVRG